MLLYLDHILYRRAQIILLADSECPDETEPSLSVVLLYIISNEVGSFT